MKTGSSETLIGWKSGKTTWDQMERVWLWTPMFLLSTTKKKKKITGVDEDVICLIMGLLCIWILYNIFMELNPSFVSGSWVELAGKCARPTRAASNLLWQLSTFSAEECFLLPYPFLTHQKSKRLFISAEFLHPWKKRPDMLSEGNAALPSSRLWQPSAVSNGSLAPFLFEFELSGSGVTALCWQ